MVKIWSQNTLSPLGGFGESSRQSDLYLDTTCQQCGEAVEWLVFQLQLERIWWTLGRWVFSKVEDLRAHSEGPELHMGKAWRKNNQGVIFNNWKLLKSMPFLFLKVTISKFASEIKCVLPFCFPCQKKHETIFRSNETRFCFFLSAWSNLADFVTKTTGPWELNFCGCWRWT